MQKTAYDSIPLTEDDKDMLSTIYDSRIRLFFISYLIMVIIGLIFSNRIDSRGSVWKDDEKRISRTQMVLINIAFVETLIVGTAVYVFLNRIQPYKKDLKLGVKAKIPYTIMKKEYFPLTNQYYVGFDDPDYLHHEIDEETYSKINEGDVMYIYRAIKSQYTFEANGRFSLM